MLALPAPPRRPHRTPSCCQVTRANPPDACRLMPTIEWAAIYARRSAVPSTAPVCERSSIVSAASSTIGCRWSTTVMNWTWNASPRCTTGRWARLSSGGRQLLSDQLCWRRSNGSANNSGDTTLIASHVAGWIDLSIAQSVRRRVGPSARVRILRPRADNKGAAWWRLAVSRGTRVADSRRPTAGIWIPILAAEKQSFVVAVVVATPRQQVATCPPQCAPLGLHVQLLLQSPQRAVRRPVRTAGRGANLPGSPAGCAHRRWSVAAAAPATSSSSSSTARATGSHGVYARPRQAGGRLSMNAWMPSIASGWIELRTPTSPTYS